MKRILAAVVVLVVVVTGIAFAQNADGDRPATIEELYLSQEIEIQIISSQARSNDRDSKLLALETVRKLYEAGDIQITQDLFTVIEALATEGTSREVRSGGRIVNYFPVVRKEAAALLGDIGGPGAKNVLLEMVREDPEPMVLAEAIYGLGKIGLNENNEVTNHLIWVLTRENAQLAPDNNLALATLLAVEKLVEQGVALDSDTVGLIIDISTNYRYITIVRDRARDVLAGLTGNR
jgi:HEAT repeat protein